MFFFYCVLVIIFLRRCSEMMGFFYCSLVSIAIFFHAYKRWFLHLLIKLCALQGVLGKHFTPKPGDHRGSHPSPRGRRFHQWQHDSVSDSDRDSSPCRHSRSHTLQAAASAQPLSAVPPSAATTGCHRGQTTHVIRSSPPSPPPLVA